jgi:hypothetical protein
MPNHPHQKERAATPSAKKKTPMDALLDAFGDVIDSGAEKMSPSELRESEKRFNEIADRVAADRKPRRETA